MTAFSRGRCRCQKPSAVALWEAKGWFESPHPTRIRPQIHQQSTHQGRQAGRCGFVAGKQQQQELFGEVDGEGFTAFVQSTGET